MFKLEQDIKNNIYKRIYLLYGEEEYLRQQYKNRLKAALVKEGDNFNFFYHDGKGVNIDEIIDLSNTMPFLASHRVIMLENCDLEGKESEEFVKIIPDICDSTIIILVEEKADKRTKLYKNIEKYGRCVEFPLQTEETIRKWILGNLKRNGFSITAGGLDSFVERTGINMTNISSEMEKLFAYCRGSERNSISEEDIRTITTATPNSQVFDMIDLCSLRKTREALDKYHELIAMKQSPFGILALIARQFNIMLQIADLRSYGKNDNEIAGLIGLPAFIIKKYNDKLKGFSMEEMERAIELCAKTDYSMKLGDVAQDLAVEILIIEISRKNEISAKQ